MDFLHRNKKAEDIAQQIIPQRKEVQPLVNTQIIDHSTSDHKHEWELLSKTYAPSRHDISVETLKTFSQADNALVDRALFGVTVFLWECQLCKVLRKEHVLGSDVTQLDEMIDKADKYGPQYIQRTDGITFILAKSSTNPTGILPMR